MKNYKTIITISAITIMAFIFIYTNNTINICPNKKTPVKTEQTTNSQLTEASIVNENESLFIGCNGFF